MYYLQSRYYDPQVGRFINADQIEYLGSSGTILSYNIFVYGENNGNNYVDALGTDAYWITDSKTLGGLGHSSLLVYTKGAWYYFYFGAEKFYKPINGSANVIFEKISIKFTRNGKIDFSDLNKQLKGSTNKTFTGTKAYKGTGYDKSIYIKGDFSSAYKYVTKTVKKMKYNVAKENCAWLCIEVLQKGKITDLQYDLLENLQYSTRTIGFRLFKRYLTISKKLPNIIVPSKVHSKIYTIFSSKFYYC